MKIKNLIKFLQKQNPELEIEATDGGGCYKFEYYRIIEDTMYIGETTISSEADKKIVEE